jgi:hypothetical protein
VFLARFEKAKVRIGFSIVGMTLQDSLPRALGIWSIALLFEGVRCLTLIARRLRCLAGLYSRSKAADEARHQYPKQT